MDNYNEVKIKDNSKKSLIYKFKLFFKYIFRKESFFGSGIVFWLVVFNIIANLSNWIILAIFSNKIDENIILHYNVYFGVDDMGNWKQVFIMPAIGTVLFFLNMFLAVFFYKNKQRIASYVLLLASFMVHMSFIIASISVLLINY